MGVWGAGLYQNDVALDVRGAYRDARSLGFVGERLASLVLDMTGAREDEDGDIAALVLADLLWRDGRLDAPRRQTALDLARRPGGIFQFDDLASRSSHAKALTALADRLVSAQRVPTKAAEPYVEQSDFKVGEALAYPDGAGGWWILRVVTLYTRFGGRSPVVEVLDWRRDGMPDASTIAGLNWWRLSDAVILGEARAKETLAALIQAGRLPPSAVWEDYETQMAAPHVPVIRTSERDPAFKKMVRLGVTVPPTRPFTSDWFIATNAWTRWKELPEKLTAYFGDRKASAD
jgi:hypothetical protein